MKKSTKFYVRRISNKIKLVFFVLERVFLNLEELFEIIIYAINKTLNKLEIAN